LGWPELEQVCLRCWKLRDRDLKLQSQISFQKIRDKWHISISKYSWDGILQYRKHDVKSPSMQLPQFWLKQGIYTRFILLRSFSTFVCLKIFDTSKAISYQNAVTFQINWSYITPSRYEKHKLLRSYVLMYCKNADPRQTGNRNETASTEQGGRLSPQFHTLVHMLMMQTEGIRTTT